MLKDRIPQRFVVKRDTIRDVWIIFDAWDPSVQDIVDINQDISESSPAIKIISGAVVMALIGEMKAAGILEKDSSPVITNVVNQTQKGLTKEDIALEGISAIKQIAVSIGLGENIKDLASISKRK